VSTSDDSGQAELADSLGTRLGPAATFATTEHFNLQTARAVTVLKPTVAPASTSLPLSSNLIALASIGQMSRLGVGIRGGRDVPASGSVLPRGHRLRASESGSCATSTCPSAWQLTLTVSGMVAVVNSVVLAAGTSLVLAAAGVHSLAIPVAVGAVIGAGAFSLHERHHRRARDAYSPEAVDRAAILIPPSQQAEAA
jgi:hypothetical protein